MITGDISEGKERVKVPVVNEINDEKPTAFEYAPTCIAGPNVNKEFNSPFYPGCDCNRRTCHKDICSCLMEYGPFFDESGCLRLFYQHNTDYCPPVFECNSLCTCSESCSNRVVQKGPHLQFQVFKTRHKGWGLRPLQKIKRFTFVTEYTGELISITEAKRRAQELTRETGNYLIVLREHSSTNQVLRTHVDAHYHGNASRFINHSCNPNLVMIPVRVDSIVPKLALFAARDINAGEELSFDYSGECNLWSKDDTQDTCLESLINRELGSKPVSCFCGSQNCKGTLPFDSSLYSSENSDKAEKR